MYKTCSFISVLFIICSTIVVIEAPIKIGALHPGSKPERLEPERYLDAAQSQWLKSMHDLELGSKHHSLLSIQQWAFNQI